MSRWLLAVAIGFVPGAARAEWKPQTAPLMTRWAKDVSPANVHPEYPRPHFARDYWLNLNGLWEYAIVDKDSAKPQAWEGQILVPFPIESALSGVMKTVGPEKKLWYRRNFTLPNGPGWNGQRTLLHFGAVDWDAAVYVNQKKLGNHRGGYDPFSFDITEYLVPGENSLEVEVWDPTDAGYQPRGKQVREPKGIWYTSVTGIWQTVWLEPVSEYRLEGVTVDTDAAMRTVEVKVAASGQRQAKYNVRTVIRDGNAVVASGDSLLYNNPADQTRKPGGTVLTASGQNWKPWSPAAPNLYSLELTVTEGNRLVDRVRSYFALRKVSLGRDKAGIPRLLLNGQPLFQYGTLDQGWWPDGLYTAPTDEALKFDIEITKKYGFNMIRKHVKVEPARWYTWCDLLGMLVWQDMPNGDKHAQWNPFGKFNGSETTRSDESAMNFREEWKHIIDARRNHPSIVMWVPFNEAWGQFDTVAVTNWTKQYDPSRLVNCASGGNDFPVGDVVDVHRYPGPTMVEPSGQRAGVLGEFGGLGLPLKGHTWQNEKNWGYRSFTSQEALTDAYLDLMDKLQPMVARGLAAAIYTQTTDVEIEVNGLLTYDRAVEKIPVDIAAAAHRRLWESTPLKIEPFLATAEAQPATWRYVVEQPADGWEQPGFDDAGWKMGTSGFGESTTPGSKVHTEWKSPDIWLRRTFEVQQLPKGELRLRIHHDEDAEIYLNGVLIKKLAGYSTEYSSLRLSTEAQRALSVGTNTLAVHCKQTGGGQYIDVGLDVSSQ